MHTLVSAGVRIRILNTGVRHRFGIYCNYWFIAVVRIRVLNAGKIGKDDTNVSGIPYDIRSSFKNNFNKSKKVMKNK